MQSIQQRCEEKLARLSGSQQSVETLGLWFLHHAGDAEQCVEAWTHAVNQGFATVLTAPVSIEEETAPGKRLPLFFLANHIFHLGKHKGGSYMENLGSACIKAAKLVISNGSPSEIKGLLRMVGIWRERTIFDQGYLDTFESILSE
eukprot:gene3288-5978_t